MTMKKDERFRLKFRNIICRLDKPGNVAEFAKGVGVSRQTIYLWLRGECMPSQRNIGRVKRYLKNVSDEQYHQSRIAKKRVAQLERVQRGERRKKQREKDKADEKEKLWDDMIDQNPDDDDETKEIIY